MRVRAPDKRVEIFTGRPRIRTYHSPFYRSRTQATRPGKRLRREHKVPLTSSRRINRSANISGKLRVF